MISTYGVNSDQHCHSWSAFSGANEKGVNNRLAGIISEMDRCCSQTREAGGHVVVMCGDLFHTRGIIEPDVFNPVREFFERKTAEGFRFIVISGNHDLQSADSNELHSAVAMLQSINGLDTYHKTTVLRDEGFVLVPWQKTSKEYIAEIERITATLGDKVKNYTLFCHIGIDGTLTGMPAHNVLPEWAASLGYKRFFSGHYHNHKDFGNGVYSVGALTHQTWGDVGTKAGFCIVTEDEVKWRMSRQPEFVDITSDMSEAEAALAADGNYVRVKLGVSSKKNVNEIRSTMSKYGAAGVNIIFVPESTATKREGVKAKSLLSLAGSVQEYIVERKMSPKVGEICGQIMETVKK